MSLIVFGLSNIGPILAVALVSAPYVALNVAEGIRGVDQSLVTMSEAFGRTPRQIRREVLIPTIVPFVFAAIRMCFAVAWKVEALTEVFGGRSGVGFQIRTEYQLLLHHRRARVDVPVHRLHAHHRAPGAGQDGEPAPRLASRGEGAAL